MRRLVVFEFADEIRDFIRQKSIDDLKKKIQPFWLCNPVRRRFLKGRIFRI